MKKYSVTIQLKASDEKELQEKLGAFQKLTEQLNHKDFIVSSNVIIENPQIIEFIKKVVISEEGKELTLLDYISVIKKVFEFFKVTKL